MFYGKKPAVFNDVLDLLVDLLVDLLENKNE